MRSSRSLTRIVFFSLLTGLFAAALAGCTLPGAAAPTATVAPLPTYAPETSQEQATTTAPTAATTPSPAVVPAAGDAASALAPAAVAAAADAALAAPVQASYSAEIAADRQVVVAAQVGGIILELPVEVGDAIHAGDLLARLDGAALEAQRAQALAGVEAAKAQLDLLKDPAREQDLAAAHAAVAAASAAYARATNGPTDEEHRLALAQLKSAQAAVDVAQAGYNRVKGDPAIAMMPKSLQLQQATLGQEAAQAQYDKLMKGAAADQIAGAYAQLANAQIALQRLQDGAKPAQIEAAEAQLHAAENALYLAQLQLNKAEITAPMDGVVAKVQSAVGALAAPNAPLLTLLSNDVRVTIAVEETRLPHLKVGQPASIWVDAYPDRTFPGVVAIIAPELDSATRTVLVTLRPTDDEGNLSPGMSATAELLAQPEAAQ